MQARSYCRRKKSGVKSLVMTHVHTGLWPSLARRPVCDRRASAMLARAGVAIGQRIGRYWLLFFIPHCVSVSLVGRGGAERTAYSRYPRLAAFSPAFAFDVSQLAVLRYGRCTRCASWGSRPAPPRPERYRGYRRASPLHRARPAPPRPASSGALLQQIAMIGITTGEQRVGSSEQRKPFAVLPSSRCIKVH